jgi:hypothetical protein
MSAGLQPARQAEAHFEEMNGGVGLRESGTGMSRVLLGGQFSIGVKEMQAAHKYRAALGHDPQRTVLQGRLFPAADRRHTRQVSTQFSCIGFQIFRQVRLRHRDSTPSIKLQWASRDAH